MTREEAIQELCEWLQQMIDHGVPNYSAKREALAYAISALSAEPSDKGGDAQMNETKSPFMQQTPSEDGSDLISRTEAIEAVKSTKPIVRSTERNWGKMIAEQHSKDLVKALKALPSADVVSREVYDTVCAEYNRLVHNAICVKLCDENCEYEKGKTCYHAREHYLINSIVPSVDRPTPNCITESANDADEKNDEVIERPIIEHDREWIIGCIKHDGFLHTDRFDKSNQIILDALTNRPSGEWLWRGFNIECSLCGDMPTFDSTEDLPTYCPSCGARMENTK